MVDLSIGSGDVGGFSRVEVSALRAELLGNILNARGTIDS